MNTRRKFLFNCSLATAALLTAKPFRSIANKLGPVTGYNFGNNSLVLAHTGNTISGNETLQHIAKLKSDSSNLIMLHAGERTPVVKEKNFYDASMHKGEAFSVAPGEYKIIYKGDIKTGVITANNNTDTASRINGLAVFLKKEKHCNLVICLSQLGLKSSGGLNDLDLAAESTHLDVIIGGHATDYCKRPMTARNKNKEEVIINHAATEGLALRKIEIGFDDRGRKYQVAFTRSC